MKTTLLFIAAFLSIGVYILATERPTQAEYDGGFKAVSNTDLVIYEDGSYSTSTHSGCIYGGLCGEAREFNTLTTGDIQQAFDSGALVEVR